MYAESSICRSRLLMFIIPFLALAGCGEGDGPTRILGTAATPLPELPAGFCDPINFEILCEPPTIINFNGGATTIIDNPDASGINDSERVAKMQKFPDEVFGGTLLEQPTPIDFSDGEFYKVKVWSPRPVVVLFKLEQQGNPNGGLAKELNHSGSSSWEELCFDFTGQTVPPPVVGLTIIFDNGTQGAADTNPGNWTFYYDDITQVASCDGSGGGSTGVVPDVTLYDPAGNPDLVIPDDYAEITPFGSQSVINEFYADDATYSPVLAVSSGTGYSANIGQIGYIGFAAGFASGYETLDFKVKGMPNFVIFVKLFDGIDTLRINLTSSAFSAALGDGWYQVSIPLSRFTGVGAATGIVFESDDSAPMQFTFFLNDIGFSGTAGGGGGGGGGGTGTELVVNGDFETGNLSGWTTFANGGTIAVSSPGSTGTFAANVDASGGPRNPTLKLSNIAAGQLTAGQAVTVSFDWKGTAAVGGVVDLVLFSETSTGGPSQTDQILSGDAFPADWTTVGPLTFNIGPDVSGGLTFQFTAICGGDATCESNLFLDNVSIIADVGGGGGGGGGGAGIIPDDVIYASDPGETVDLVFGVDYADFSPFGSGSTFNNNVTTDADFNRAFGVTTGNGYGAQVGQFAIVGFATGFASGYATLDFKAKGLNNDLIRIKFLDDPNYLDITLTSSPYSTALGNGWYQVSVPLTAVSGVAAATGLLFETDGTAPSAFTFLLTDFGFSGTAGGGGGGGAGDIAINGGFETGDFSGWETFPGGGIQQITTDNPSSGTYAANLTVPVRSQTDPAVDNLLKNANLQAGNLTPGAPVTVTFDMRGSLSGAGGVVFAEFFSELTGGGTSKAEIFTGGPLTPVTAWTPYSFSTTLGPDVSGGATLQLKASCGPVEGCGVDVFFDNVSITIN